ncbi:hypothetical protein AGMMS49949_00640 [Alphaproteobacteria bacterium]|nr:hypothetical protein AGMMS49949_00640 [Alphaproteobacteria bacterium]GHS98252.1 hypothetical protein AGMMS50296_5810 [Alphaproteobacteria bacterium]
MFIKKYICCLSMGLVPLCATYPSGKEGSRKVENGGTATESEKAEIVNLETALARIKKLSDSKRANLELVSNGENFKLRSAKGRTIIIEDNFASYDAYEEAAGKLREGIWGKPAPRVEPLSATHSSIEKSFSSENKGERKLKDHGTAAAADTANVEIVNLKTALDRIKGMKKESRKNLGLVCLVDSFKITRPEGGTMIIKDDFSSDDVYMETVGNLRSAIWGEQAPALDDEDN